MKSAVSPHLTDPSVSAPCGFEPVAPVGTLTAVREELLLKWGRKDRMVEMMQEGQGGMVEG